MFRIVLVGLVVWVGFASGEPADRAAAEWVLRLGGKVTLEGRGRPVTDLADLPAPDFRLESIDLVGTLAEPQELEKLKDLTHLRELFLAGPMWTPHSGSKLDANDAFEYLNRLTSLEKLHFSAHFLTNTNVQDKGLARLAPLTQLKELRLAQTEIKGTSLAPFVNLRCLDLSETPFGDAGMQSLKGMTALSKLYLRDTLVTDEGLQVLAGLTSLMDLDLYGLRVTDAGLAHLRNLTGLRKLNLLGSEVTDSGLGALDGMAQLEELNLYRSQITNAGLERLKTKPHLVALDVRYTRATRAGVDALHAALPRCRIAYVGQPAIAPQRAALLAGARVEGWVRAMGGRVVEREGRIEEIALASTPVTDAQLARLADLAQLEKLNLNATEIGDVGLEHLARLTRLADLSHKNTTVSDAGLARLQTLKNLRRLSLAYTLVKGPGLDALKELPAL